MAFIATLIGVASANIVWLPIANALKVNSSHEVAERRMAITGILAIQAGDNPRIVAQKLDSFGFHAPVQEHRGGCRGRARDRPAGRGARLMARSKRRGGEAVHENAERWLLTYADMITLLMVLFVVMYAISNTDVRKFTALAQSFSAAFNNDVLQGTETISISDALQTTPEAALLDESSSLVSSDYRTVSATLRDYAISQGLGGDVSVDRVPEGIAIRISDTLLFQSGRARLDEPSRKVLARIAAIVAPLPNALRIEGHTDDLPPTGPFYADNWQLSTARALAVLDEMRNLGIGPERLAAAGYAGYRPIVANTDDAARAHNRRVDILILYVESPTPSALATDPPFAIGGLP